MDTWKQASGTLGEYRPSLWQNPKEMGYATYGLWRRDREKHMTWIVVVSELVFNSATLDSE